MKFLSVATIVYLTAESCGFIFFYDLFTTFFKNGYKNYLVDLRVLDCGSEGVEKILFYGTVYVDEGNFI